MMRSRGGHALAEGSNRGLSQRVRTSPRAFLRLEMLETRCLLSGWLSKVGPGIDRPPAVERPASDVARIPYDGLEVRDAQPTESGKLSPTHPPSASQDLDTNYVGDSTGSPDVTPGLAGLPQANYVIVPESSKPHHTIASAQVLPDLPYFGVVGTLGAGDGIDLYQLALDSISERLDFGLVMQGSGASVPATFQILDGSGQVLGTWNLGSVGNSSIQVNIEKPSPGSILYLGLSAGSSSTPVGAFGTVDYQLWVARQPALLLTSSSIGNSTQPVLALSVLSPLLIPLAALGLSSPKGVSATALTAPGTISATASATVGSLAIRSAGASRGLLSSDEPAPLAVQGPGASASQEVASGSLARLESQREGEPRPGEPAVAGRDPEASVVVISTGGFPLMGATAVGYWRWRGTDPEAVPEMTAPALEARSEGVKSTGDPDLDGRPAVLLAEGEVIAKEQAVRLRAWGGFPVSVFSGLGVAIVLTLNAVLSQPIAGYDYLTARLYRSHIRAFPRRKPSK
ncbi:MAG: hypothetical protein WBX00_27220 [Isosphaeraceae bacterium]